MPVAIGAAENTFANPIGLLSDCHRRMERFLQILLALATKVEGGHLDAEQRSALDTALKYFREAAPKHTADEEADLFPMLRQLAGPRISKVLANVDRLEGEHKTAEAWHREVEDICDRWIRQEGLPAQDAARLTGVLTSFSDLYRSHITIEEQEVFPVAQAELSDSAKQAIGLHMASRRGVPFVPQMFDRRQHLADTNVA